MMIRPLSDSELASFVDIVAHAYPGFDRLAPEAREQDLERLRAAQQADPTVQVYGLVRDGQVLGGMRIHQFRMQVRTVRIPAGGVGLVAVDLLHKKEKVAKEMMAFFLRHCRREGMPIALLYPFRPDFYRRMGFGYGTKMSQYRVRPASFPRAGSKEHLVQLGLDDREALSACYSRLLARTHGLLEKSDREWDRLLQNPRLRVVAYREGSDVRGYMAFRFHKGSHFVQNDLEVVELLYESDEARAELMTFLHTQADQIERVVVNVQDELFHHLLEDPRDGSDHLIPSVYHQTNTQGVGIMYRLVDVGTFFEALRHHPFGADCRLRITLDDSFLPENAGSYVFGFRQTGVEPVCEGDEEVEIQLDVADFSSVAMGVVPLQQLVAYGRVEITEPALLDRVTTLFWNGQKPICLTPF
jgi:predicted acetyltransferase